MSRCLVATFFLLLAPDAASAQHRFTVSGGAAWLGGYPVGGTTASLRNNEPGTTTPSVFTLFAVDTSIERAAGVTARVGVPLTRAFELEAAGAYSNPALAASISRDAEGESIRLADQRIAQLAVDGSLIWNLPWVGLGSRLAPYAIGGAGYLRQIDDDRTRVEHGTVGHLGGGVRYWLRGNGMTRRAAGLRAEARLQLRAGGFEFAEKTRAAPAVYLLATFGL